MHAGKPDFGDATAQTQPERVHRNWPRRFAVGVATVVFLVGLANLARGGLAIAWATRLPDLPMTVGWDYLAFTGLLWGAVFVVCAIALAGFYCWARTATLAATTVFEIHVWVNHLLFGASDYALATWPRDLLLTALFLALIWGTLSWPTIRREFGGG